MHFYVVVPSAVCVLCYFLGGISNYLIVYRKSVNRQRTIVVEMFFDGLLHHCKVLSLHERVF